MKLAVSMPIVLFSIATAVAQTAPANNPFNSIKPEKVSKVVVSNIDTIIDYSFTLNPDCSSGGNVQHRIVKKPMHGEITLTEGDQYPNYQAPNVRVSCNSQRTKAAEVHYKSTDGFSGMDSADIVTIYPDGSADRYVYDIIVG